MYYSQYVCWKSIELNYAGKTRKSKLKTGLKFIDENIWSGVGLE